MVHTTGWVLLPSPHNRFSSPKDATFCEFREQIFSHFNIHPSYLQFFYQQYRVSNLLCCSFFSWKIVVLCFISIFWFSIFHSSVSFISPWNLKQPFINSCFNWMMNQIFTIEQ